MSSKSDNKGAPDVIADGGLLSRRYLLGSGLSGAGFGLTANAQADAILPDWVTEGGPAPQKAYVQPTLIIPFENYAPGFGFSGTPLQYLRGWITPNGLHFEMHHGGRPEIDPAQHRLMIHGLVELLLRFALEALERYPMTSSVHFLECAGNSGRNASENGLPQIAIDQLHGLVSNVEWTGVPMVACFWMKKA